MDTPNNSFFSRVFGSQTRSPVPPLRIPGSQTPAQPQPVPQDGTSTPSLPFLFGMTVPGSATISGTPPVPLFSRATEEEMDADMDRLCDTRPCSPDLETQSPPLTPDLDAMGDSMANAPFMSCLGSPTMESPTNDAEVPPRSTSARSDAEFENPQRPHKVARVEELRSMNDRRMLRSRSVFTRSANALPQPDSMPLLSLSLPQENTVVLEGLRFPAVPGIENSHTHYRITAETAAGFMDGVTYPMPPKCKLIILDARSKHEYDIGHVKGAINITVPGIRSQINDLVRNARRNDETYFVLCYCEFSSARAPNLRDVILAAEKDIMYQERKTAELRTSEKSRFHVLIIEKGYNRFFEVNPGLCEPMGYIKEEHLPEEVDKPYRTLYHSEIDDARASQILGPSSFRRTKSSMDLMHRHNRSENRDLNLTRSLTYISDDEGDFISPRPRIKPPVFDDK